MAKDGHPNLLIETLKAIAILLLVILICGLVGMFINWLLQQFVEANS